MNEDDTARRLKKIDFIDLVFKLNNLPFEESEILRKNTELMQAWLDQYGWTVLELGSAAVKYLKELDERNS